MSLSEAQMMDVMSLADGELEGEDLERTKKLVEEDAEAKELFASLRAIGDGVRGSFDVPKIDVRDAVMRTIVPNDLDKARIKRTARTRMAVVGVSLLAVAAAVMFYVRDHELQQAQNAAKDAGTQAVLASSSPTGVEVDFVDTPTPVSLFYVPAEKTTSGAEGKTTETPASVIVWVDDSSGSGDPTP